MPETLEDIKQQRKKWISAVSKGDLETYLSLLCENIVWIPPETPAVHGIQSMREWLEPFFRKFEYEFNVSNINTRIAGDWTVEHGTFSSNLKPRTGGDTMTHTGRYIIIWHREKDGEWRIERYIDVTQVY